MASIVQVFKSILKIGKLEEDEEKNLEEDIRTYTTIINSSKYADSNSDTNDLEKLVKAMSVNAKLNDEKFPTTDTPITVVSNEPEITGSQQFQDVSETNDVPPAVKPESQIAIGTRKAQFMIRLANHLNLLDELEGERATVLPGQPVYKPPKFGREGGNNFVLPQFRIPGWVYDAMEGNTISRLDLQTPLTPENYIRRFQTLLWVEEAHQAIEMRQYDLSGVMLGKYDERYFLLVVPGLAEGRPSLLRGDKLILKSVKRSSYYEGYIYEVREHDVLIKLHASLHSTAMDGLRFDVSFLHSRTPFRRSHHGVVQSREGYSKKGILFPKPNSDPSTSPMIDVKETSPESFRCFQKYLNIHQKRAVINVLVAKCRPAPYIIFGPPGTGKTVTMVEAVLQVYARSHSCKILVCGNSNSCADILATRIKDSGVVSLDRMVRISAFYRMEKLIPPEIEDITKDMDMISSSMYSGFRVVVTTCIQSGALNDFRDEFDYVFIDEAGHANEPEALISISLMKKGGCVVLAGDPHQLGPVCMSHVSAHHGYGTSLLERLYKLPVYQRQMRDSKMVYDERYLTKLIICYRSDPRVMVVNNELFYDNELEFVIETPKKWLKFLKIENPLVFHQVKGKDLREYVNPSWFNPNEAIQCLCYAKRLYEAGLKPHQLGIITPYRRQIEKLNVLFESCQLKKCKIATMEEFQGDEREVIIISTVRTRIKNIKFDQQFNLGFLFNPKRFNVAISRAKWLAIVIGDSDILGRDDCWVKYIKSAQKIDVQKATPDSQATQ